MGSELTVTNAFQRALAGEPQRTPPIWLMRQAGRYHAHYQALRRQHRFEDLCRVPDLAATVAMGPIEDFDFDAAILFSDLLFPLEALGMSLSYDDGPPKLDGPLDEARIAGFRTLEEALPRLRFQADAIAETRRRLPAEKGLIGFVGGPWTLFVYAMEGSHSGAMRISKSSWSLYRQFAAAMVPLLKAVIVEQLDAGADVVMMLDTAAGDLPPDYFDRDVAPDLVAISRSRPERIGYYAKASHPSLLTGALGGGRWAGFGFDSRWRIADLLKQPGRRGFVQGNFDPAWLFLPRPDLEDAIAHFLEPILALPESERRGWICGLGHGVLPGTPEDAVRLFVESVRRTCA